MTKKKVAISASIITIIVCIIVAFLFRNAKLKRAEYSGGKLVFDNHVYEEISYKEIEPYNETWKTICKTKDGVWTIYEIEEYPDHEYVIARTSWDGRVLKLKN